MQPSLRQVDFHLREDIEKTEGQEKKERHRRQIPSNSETRAKKQDTAYQRDDIVNIGDAFG